MQTTNKLYNENLKVINVNCVPQPKMNSSVQKFSSELNKNLKLGMNVFVAADGNILLNRIKKQGRKNYFALTVRLNYFFLFIGVCILYLSHNLL